MQRLQAHADGDYHLFSQSLKHHINSVPFLSVLGYQLTKQATKFTRDGQGIHDADFRRRLTFSFVGG